MNLSESTPTPALGAIIRANYKFDHYHIDLNVVKYDPAKTEITNHTSFDDNSEFADLHISCQGSADFTDRKTYAFNVEYKDIYSLHDVSRINKMAKLLTKIEKGLHKIYIERGYPQSFADYVGRVGSIIGIKHYLRCRKQNGGSSYRDSTWQVFTPGEAIGFIHSLETRWLENDVENALVA